MESIKNFILEALNAPENLKMIKKWFKDHKGDRLKLTGDTIYVTGKSGAVHNSITFLPGETELPDYINIEPKEYTASLDIFGNDLTTFKGIPMPGPGAYLNVFDCNNLEDFDTDISKNTSLGSITFKNCKKLKSFSALDTLKTRFSYFYLHDCPNLSSLKDFYNKNIVISKIENCGLDSLEGFPLIEVSSVRGPVIEVHGCSRLKSLDIVGKKTPSDIIITDCKNLSEVGNCSWPKDGETNRYDFNGCSNVDENFFEKIYDMSSHTSGWATINLKGTKVKEDSEIIKRIKSEIPEVKIYF